jgi:chromosome segregation ATPase
LRNEKLSKLERLDETLKNSGERLIEFSDDCHTRFQALREQISKLFSQIDSQNNTIDASYDQKMQYLHTLEEKVVERFEQEAKLRKEMERKAILLIDERYNYLINELNKEAKNRNESLENFHKIIESDIPKIQESLKEEQNEMMENDNAVSNRITEETQRLINMVLNEKKAREETEEALLEMLKAMINAMKTQLENEKRERQSTQEYLINLLDDMCGKITKANDII